MTAARTYTRISQPVKPLPALLLACATTLTALPIYAQTLAETVDLALHYQSSLKVGELQILDQEAALLQAQARDGLTLTLAGSAGRGHIDTPANVLFPEAGTHNMGVVDLEANYPIYTAGRREVGISVAQAGLAAAQSSVQDAQMQTRFAAIASYCAIVRDQALLKLARDTQLSLDRAVSDAQKRLKVGEVTKTDVAQASAQQAQGLATQTRAVSALIIDQARYRQLTGVDPVDLPTVLQAPTVPSSLQLALAQMPTTPALEAARQQLVQAEQQLALTKLELSPTVSIQTYASEQRNENFINTQVGNYGINLKASIPLLDGGVNRANRQRGQVQVDLARERINGLSQSIEQRIRQDYAQYTASQLQVSALEQTIVAAQLALDTIRREIELGTRTTFDLLTAQRTLQDAETQKILNQQDQIIAAYQLLADTGQLKQVQ